MLSVELGYVILQQFEDLACAFSLKCAILWRYKEWEQLLELDAQVDDFDSPADYFRAAQALALFKKLKGLVQNDEQRRLKTVAKWYEGESQCYQTNLRLQAFLGDFSERDDRLVPHLGEIRLIIEEMIGARPPASFEKLGRFGPGATYGDRGGFATVPHKIAANPTLTRDAMWYLFDFFGNKWGQALAHDESGQLNFVRGNRFAVVPKTSKIDRAIGVEPSINVFYQLAIGTALRSRLSHSTGWDLDHAQDIHRRIAREASVSREFATLDLSNASDTVAYNLVKLLLPSPWFDVMNDLRSPMTLMPPSSQKDVETPNTREGSWVKLEKFSSMGNGFTFELETIIFAAVACHCSRLCGFDGVLGKDVFVFGDDIIVKDGVFETVKHLLQFLGFSLNKEKSFHGQSPFRESCGADYYLGSDVRPVYLKDDPRDPKAAIGVANRVRTIIEKLTHLVGAAPSNRAYLLAVSFVPLPYRSCRGPRGLGDAVIWDEDAKCRWKNSIRYYRAALPGDLRVVRFGGFSSDVVLACATYGTGNNGTPQGGPLRPQGVIPRDPIRSYRVGWLASS